MNNLWKYILPFLVIVGLVVASSLMEPPTFMYSPSFSKDHVRPYGAQVLHTLMEDIFTGEISTTREPVYNVFADSVYYERTAYVAINNTFEPDAWDIDYMTDFVEEGNYVLIAATYLSQALEDSLGGVRIQDMLYYSSDRDSLPPYFTNETLNPASDSAYDFSKGNMRNYFLTYPGEEHVIAEMPYLNDPNEVNPVALYIPRGEGAFILSCTPYAFTNYQLLNAENHDYVSKLLSFIPEDANILWDEYYKVENLQNLSQSSSKSGLLGFIRSQPGLSMGWTLFLVGVILYVFSEVKRKQRTVPVITPHPNATLEFTQTSGQLYYSREDHKSIAEKKVKVWLEYVRSHYYMKTTRLDKEFVEKLAAKSGVQEGTLKSIIGLASRIDRQANITEATLIDLTVAIESFYEKSAR